VNEARPSGSAGIPIDYMRIKAFPVHAGGRGVPRVHDKIFVVEQNRDAQLKSLLILETDVHKSKLHSILHYNGLPMTSKEIVEAGAGPSCGDADAQGRARLRHAACPS